MILRGAVRILQKATEPGGYKIWYQAQVADRKGLINSIALFGQDLKEVKRPTQKTNAFHLSSK